MQTTTLDPLAQLKRTATVTIPVAAALLGISRETAYRLARQGTLPGALRVGPNSIRVRSSDLLAVLVGVEPAEHLRSDQKEAS